MAGKLYGVGTGPGDPELLTLKALRVIRECDVIAAPGRQPEETTAYRIVSQVVSELGRKTLLGIHMPMTKDAELLEKSHKEGVRLLREHLDKGETIAFLTLGDPTVYSTYMYLHKEIQKLGYDVEIVSGIPSFCAAAARLNMGIAEQSEQIHIIPASYQIDEALELPGTKILMKAGKNLPEVKRKLEILKKESTLQEQKRQQRQEKQQSLENSGVYAMMVENCGMEEEHIYAGFEQIPENAGYYSILFVKDQGEK